MGMNKPAERDESILMIRDSEVVIHSSVKEALIQEQLDLENQINPE